MSVPRLIDIAVDEVVKCIVGGKFNNVDCILPARPSNKIFGIIKKYKYIRDDKIRRQVAKVQFRMLRPSKMDLYCPQENMGEWDSHMTYKQNLVALRLGWVKSVNKYYKQTKKKEPNYFDIVALLEDMLNPVSRRILMELDITNVDYTLPANWTVKIGSMLPSLNVLNMAGDSWHQSDLTSSEFSNLCSSFPNLTELDISCSTLPSLKGISKLKHLNVLSVDGLNLNESSDIEELFELKKIRELRMAATGAWHGNTSNILTFFIQSNQHLPRLEVLDCSEAEINDEGLDNIIKRHPTLKKVVAHDTDIERSEIPGIELLTMNDLVSVVKSLAHVRQKGNTYIVRCFVFKLAVFTYQEPLDRQSSEGLKMAIQEMREIIFQYKYDEEIMEYVMGCCENMAEPDKIPLLGSAEKIALADIIIGFFEHGVELHSNHHSYLEDINRLHTPQPGSLTNRACAVALDFFLLADGNSWGLDCLKFVEQSMNHVDGSSGFVLATDKKTKMMEVLRIMNQSRDLKQKHKKMARRVLRFVEKN